MSAGTVVEIPRYPASGADPRYTEFRGHGDPGSRASQIVDAKPGDVYVDLTKGSEALYAFVNLDAKAGSDMDRCHWKKWHISPDKTKWLTYTQNRYLWCSATRIIWYSERSLRGALKDLLGQSPVNFSDSKSQGLERRCIAEMLIHDAELESNKRFFSSLDKSDNESEGENAHKRRRQLSPGADSQEGLSDEDSGSNYNPDSSRSRFMETRSKPNWRKRCERLHDKYKVLEGKNQSLEKLSYNSCASEKAAEAKAKNATQMLVGYKKKSEEKTQQLAAKVSQAAVELARREKGYGAERIKYEVRLREREMKLEEKEKNIQQLKGEIDNLRLHVAAEGCKLEQGGVVGNDIKLTGLTSGSESLPEPIAHATSGFLKTLGDWVQGSEQKVLAGEQSAKQLEGRLVEKEKRIDEVSQKVQDLEDKLAEKNRLVEKLSNTVTQQDETIKAAVGRLLSRRL